MSSRSKLFLHKKVYDKDTDVLFFDAVRENIGWHLMHCSEARKFLCKP